MLEIPKGSTFWLLDEQEWIEKSGASRITHVFGWMAGTAVNVISSGGEWWACVSENPWKAGWLGSPGSQKRGVFHHSHSWELPHNKKKMDFGFICLLIHYFTFLTSHVLHRCLHQQGPVPTTILHLAGWSRQAQKFCGTHFERCSI